MFDPQPLARCFVDGAAGRDPNPADAFVAGPPHGRALTGRPLPPAPRGDRAEQQAAAEARKPATDATAGVAARPAGRTGPHRAVHPAVPWAGPGREPRSRSPSVVAVTTRKVHPSEVLLLTRAASPQFFRPITVRVIRVLDWIMYDGWLWIDAYQLGPDGMALARRSLYFMPEGAQEVEVPAVAPESRRPVRRDPVRVGG